MDSILLNITTEVTLVEHRRIQFNLSVQDVVDELGISRTSYYNKINGLVEFKIKELVILGEIYGDNYKNYLNERGQLVKGKVLLN